MYQYLSIFCVIVCGLLCCGVCVVVLCVLFLCFVASTVLLSGIIALVVHVYRCMCLRFALHVYVRGIY